ncbi:MAG TPA: CvpA family protein [Acidimicrobiia bacterium]|nr:CvpA family protein [Acidimicrobiia bacterium]
MIIDLLFIVFLGALAVRGWTRGFVREFVDIIGLVLGIILSFRLAPIIGGVVSAMSGLSADGGRLVAGVLVFAAVIVGLVLIARTVDRRIGVGVLGTADAAGGSTIAVLWGVFLLTVCLTVVAVMPLPERVDAWVRGSPMSRVLTDPNGAPQKVFARLAGDRVVLSLLSLQDVFGERRVIIGPDDTIDIPPANPDDLAPDPISANDVYQRLNRARVDEGLDPLAWSDALAEVAEGHAYDMYLNGFFSHTSPTTGSLVDRLRAAGLTYRVAGENLALAATPQEVHDGLMDSPGHRANIVGDGYRRVGIAVVSGRLGLMTVQVFMG